MRTLDSRALGQDKNSSYRSLLCYLPSDAHLSCTEVPAGCRWRWSQGWQSAGATCPLEHLECGWVGPRAMVAHRQPRGSGAWSPLLPRPKPSDLSPAPELEAWQWRARALATGTRAPLSLSSGWDKVQLEALWAGQAHCQGVQTPCTASCHQAARLGAAKGAGSDEAFGSTRFLIFAALFGSCASWVPWLHLILHSSFFSMSRLALHVLACSSPTHTRKCDPN